MGTFCTSSAVPAFPGAQYTVLTRGDCFNFQQRACSRPPLPITRTFTATPLPERSPSVYRRPILRTGHLSGQAHYRRVGRMLESFRPGRMMVGSWANSRVGVGKGV